MFLSVNRLTNHFSSISNSGYLIKTNSCFGAAHLAIDDLSKYAMCHVCISPAGMFIIQTAVVPYRKREKTVSRYKSDITQ